jgi:hypothetical protein
MPTDRTSQWLDVLSDAGADRLPVGDFPGLVEALFSPVPRELVASRCHRYALRREPQSIAKTADRVRLRDVLVEVLVDKLGECQRRRSGGFPRMRFLSTSSNQRRASEREVKPE